MLWFNFVRPSNFIFLFFKFNNIRKRKGNKTKNEIEPTQLYKSSNGFVVVVAEILRFLFCSSST